MDDILVKHFVEKRVFQNTEFINYTIQSSLKLFKDALNVSKVINEKRK